jgi:hypothetical protein
VAVSDAKFHPVTWIMGMIAAMFVAGSLAWAGHISSKVDTIGEILGELKQINYRLDEIDKRLRHE